MGPFEKYARQTALAGFGEEGQRRLAESSAAVVGAGGVGSGALPLLAASGIGRLAVFDFDAVSETNLHRQTLYGADSVGKPKAKIAAEKLSALNPDCEISFFGEPFDNSEKFSSILKGCRICIDATDSFSSRLAVSAACARAEIPEILASAAGYVCQMMVFGGGFYFDKCVGSDPLAAREKSAGLPVFPAAAHLAGAWAVGAALGFLSGCIPLEIGEFRMFDFSSASYRRLELRRAQKIQIPKKP